MLHSVYTLHYIPCYIVKQRTTKGGQLGADVSVRDARRQDSVTGGCGSTGSSYSGPHNRRLSGRGGSRHSDAAGHRPGHSSAQR